jgi:hypothetical protein
MKLPGSWRRSLAVAAVAGLALVAWSLFRSPDRAKPMPPEPAPLVPLEEIVEGGPPPDGIPPIDAPKFVAAAEAEAYVRPSTLGILVTVGSTSRFYPYNILTWHEIVNDEIGGRPLAITFCPLCATGFVFERRAGDRLLDFGTSGKLYQSNLVMYDRQTASLWPQVLMKAVVGPLAGTELKLYPAAVTEFRKARAAHPDLQVLSTDTGHARDYVRNPYQGYEESDEVWFPVSRTDDRLPPKALVFIVPLAGAFKAYHWSDLLERRMLEDEVAGRKIVIRLSETDEPVVTDATDGARVVGFHAFWFSAAAVHPDIALWTGK